MLQLKVGCFYFVQFEIRLIHQMANFYSSLPGVPIIVECAVFDVMVKPYKLLTSFTQLNSCTGIHGPSFGVFSPVGFTPSVAC